MKNITNTSFISRCTLLIATAATLILLCTPLHASNKLEVSGFATWAVSKSNNATPWYVNREITDETCYNCDTVWGIQLDYQALDSVRLSAQVVKRPEDPWDKPEVEWAYAGYSPTDNLEIRVGKLRLPLFLMSEYYYVGNAYPWVRPVAELYNRQLGITASEGIDLVYDWYISDEYTLTVHPYYGDKKEGSIDQIDSILEFKSDYKYGIAFDLTTEKMRLHINYFEIKGTEISFNSSPKVASTIPITPSTNIVASIQARTFIPKKIFGTYKNTAAGITYELPLGFEVWAEYQFDKSNLGESVTQYAALTWHFNNFTPYYIYSEGYSTDTSDNTLNNHTKDKKYDVSDTQTLGLRYDLPKNISINLEYSLSTSKEHAPIGCGALPPAQCSTQPPKGMFVTSYWEQDLSTGQWKQVEDNKADIWTFAINWNF